MISSEHGVSTFPIMWLPLCSDRWAPSETMMIRAPRLGTRGCASTASRPLRSTLPIDCWSMVAAIVGLWLSCLSSSAAAQTAHSASVSVPVAAHHSEGAPSVATVEEVLAMHPEPPFLNAQGRPLLSTLTLLVHFPLPGGGHNATEVPLPIYLGETFDEALARFCGTLESLVSREGEPECGSQTLLPLFKLPVLQVVTTLK